MSTTEANQDVLAVIRERIAAKRQERAQAVEGLKTIDAELKGLATAEKALDPSASVAKRETSFDVAKRVMKEMGTSTIAQLAVEMGKPKNTAKLALARLEEQGFIRKTGNAPGRSPEYTLADSEQAA